MKMTKKFFKETEVRNVQVSKQYYTDKDLRKLEDAGIISYFPQDPDKEDPRIFLHDVSELKVVLNAYNDLAIEAVLQDPEVLENMELSGENRIYVEIY